MTMMNHHVLAIILTRMTSSRLPGKALIDICGQPNLKRILDRVKRARKLNGICVATTINREDDPIAALAVQESVSLFRGDEHDVLGRVYQAAVQNNATVIVRLTADCPMIDPDVIDRVVELYQTGDYDYVANRHIPTWPDGLDVEVFSFTALEKAHEKAGHKFLREHVTPYIRGSHPQYGHGDFRIGNLICEANFGHIRWTLDTKHDLEILRALIGELPDGYSWMDALALATRYPALLGIGASSAQ